MIFTSSSIKDPDLNWIRLFLLLGSESAEKIRIQEKKKTVNKGKYWLPPLLIIDFKKFIFSVSKSKYLNRQLIPLD